MSSDEGGLMSKRETHVYAFGRDASIMGHRGRGGDGYVSEQKMTVFGQPSRCRLSRGFYKGHYSP